MKKFTLLVLTVLLVGLTNYVEASESVLTTVLDMMEAQQYSEALEILEQLNVDSRELSPDILWIWSALYVLSGQEDLALEKSTEAFSLKNDPDPLAHRRMGIILLQNEKYSNAIAHFKETLLFWPEDLMTHYYLSLAYSELAETDPFYRQASEEHWLKTEKYIQSVNDFPSLGHYYLGRVYEAKDKKKAEHHYHQLILRHQPKTDKEYSYMVHALVFLLNQNE